MSDLTVASISFKRSSKCMSLAVTENGTTILDIKWKKALYVCRKSEIEISDDRRRSGSPTIKIKLNETTLGTKAEISIVTEWCTSSTCFLTHQSRDDISEMLFAATRL